MGQSNPRDGLSRPAHHGFDAKMRAAVFQEPGRIVPEGVADPVMADGQLRLDVAACGICGSDLESWRTGAYTSPGSILGHELVGTVAEGGEAIGLRAGEAVVVRPLTPCRTCRFCHRGDWQLCAASLTGGIGYGIPGGFAEQVVVPDPVLGLTVFRWPDTLRIEDGALVEPLAVGLHALHRARLAVGDVAVVVGLGPIGLGIVALAVAHGAQQVIGIDPSPLRRDAAVRLGATMAADPADGVEAVRQVTGAGSHGLGAAADVALECSGVPSAFAQAVKTLGPGGRLALVAHSREPVGVKSGRIIEKELDVVGAFAYRDEIPEVIDLMASGRLSTTGLVSHRLGLDDAEGAFEVQADPTASLKVLFVPT